MAKVLGSKWSQYKYILFIRMTLGWEKENELTFNFVILSSTVVNELHACNACKIYGV